jgi:hypothetical protein
MLVALFPFAPVWSAGKLETTILDVGQGDSLFVVLPHGKTLLIDGGGAFGGFPGQEERNGIDPGEEAVSPYLWSRGFQKIDVVAFDACASGSPRRLDGSAPEFPSGQAMDWARGGVAGFGEA